MSTVHRQPSTVNRIVFMGTPAFALPTLAALHESPHEVVAVYSQPPRPAGRGQKEQKSPVHQYASSHNLPVFTPETLKTPDAQAQFAAHKADIAVVVAYGLLLPKPILTACPKGCINVHPSLLPRWRGAAPIQRTIMAGDNKTAIVIMQMDAGLDTGDMLLVEHYDIAPGTNAGALHDFLAPKAGPLVLKTLDGLQNGSIIPIRQPETGIAYAKKITKDDCRINWQLPAEAIYQQILGLSPSPGAFFAFGGETIKVFDARIEQGSGTPGTTADDALAIFCGEGLVRPTLLQRPNKKRMSADELLRGFALPAGTRLE